MKKLLPFLIVLLFCFPSHAWEVWYFDTYDWDEVYISLFDPNNEIPVAYLPMTNCGDNYWYYQDDGVEPAEIKFENGEGWTSNTFKFINGNYYLYDGTNASLIIDGIGYGNFESTNNTCGITGLFGELSGEINIPATVKYDNQYFSVTSIGDGVFAFCEEINGITLPESLISIGERAFDYCISISYFFIPSSVASIGKNAFLYCFALEAIEVSEDNQHYSSIDGILFDKNQETLIRCPRWFNGIFILDPYEVPGNVIKIEENAFENVIIPEITLGEAVETIGKDAFWGCSNLTSINVVENNPYFSSIGGVLFNKNQDTILSYPIGKEETQYNLPASVKKIDDRVFQLTHLRKVTLNDELEEIGERAFYMSDIEEIIFPNSVRLIGKEAFAHCESLSSITFGSSDMILEDFAFWYTSLKEVSVPENVKSIGSHVFAHCPLLSEIDINVPLLGEHMFSDCPSLNVVKLGDQVRDLGYGTFSNCHSLVNMEIPESINSLGEWTFFDCIGLKTINIPNSVTKIGERVFQLCSGLESIQISASVTSIGELAFWECTELKDIIIPESVEHVRAYAFEGCAKLENVELFTSIDEWYVFGRCESLKNLTIGPAVKQIDGSTFQDCYGIEKITCLNKIPPESSDNLFMDEVYQSATLYVPEESLNDYSLTEPWRYFLNIETAGVETLYGNETFCYSVFDLSGKCLLNKVRYNELSKLPKGLYIINGKKVMIGK